MEEDVYLDLFTSPLPNLWCLGLGAVFKYAGDCKIIYDLLVPSDLGTNNFVVPNSYSLTYCSHDDACTKIKQRGKRALLSKFDLINAFWLFPVRQSVCNLLGIHLKNKYYMHGYVLTFWAAVNFIHFQSACQWHSLNSVTSIQSLPLATFFGWFLTAVSAHSNVSQQNLSQMLYLCNEIDAAIKTEKVEGPTTCLTFLHSI